MSSFTIDPEFAELCPPLTIEERSGLEGSIEADGCLHPLIIWKGQDILVDGHNRYSICKEFGWEFKTILKSFESREDVKEFIIRLQFNRRNLQPFQRAELALKLKEVIAAKAKKNQQDHGGTAPGKSLIQISGEVLEPVRTDKEIAKLAGVSHDTIHKASVIAEKAPEPVKEQLRKGETTINAAYKELKASDPSVQTIAKPRKPKPAEDDGDAIDPCWDILQELSELTKSATLKCPYSEIKKLVADLKAKYIRRYSQGK